MQMDAMNIWSTVSGSSILNAVSEYKVGFSFGFFGFFGFFSQVVQSRNRSAGGNRGLSRA